MNFTRYSAIVFCLFALIGKSVCAAEPPSVVVTIKPVHSLVAGVAKGVFKPQLLIDGVASPHHFQLKPSAIRKLNQADQVFWIGEGLEVFLIKALASLADQDKAIKLIDVPGLSLLPLRTEDFHDDHGHEASDVTKHDDKHHGTKLADFHLWLDPQNALILVGAIAEALSVSDPANALTYRANAVEMQQRLQQLEAELREVLKTSFEQSFLVFHDSFQYFEKRFDLAAAGVISIHPDAQPGALRIRELQQQISSESVECLFSEPQFESRSVEMLVRDTSIKHAVIDPLGVSFDTGPELYFEWLAHTAQIFSDCLSS